MYVQTTQLEFCQGYTDKNGIWNNGFYCRKWGKEDDKYCCGEGTAPYCCPEPTKTTSLPTSSASTPFAFLSSSSSSHQRQQQFMRHLVGPTSAVANDDFLFDGSGDLVGGHANSHHHQDTGLQISPGQDLFPVIVGAGVGGALMLLSLLLVCLLCPCCPCYVRRHRKRSSKPIVGNQSQ
ncbi:hypothetical protein HELRODRAFT_171021 [Helobdella robusta]|uniref:Shisa N-terminal domain-containing protein n=1 Tax=Helobdella robusta TaxID=6412 RepID=T1F3Q0_HELRO|nr:hypothetical protein HELRODRAFT_171021 [Helobdella robusta]ESO06985.1 hypothetical protein HELRODRAFT_171021 [Helobdella robusta]